MYNFKRTGLLVLCFTEIVNLILTLSKSNSFFLKWIDGHTLIILYFHFEGEKFILLKNVR